MKYLFDTLTKNTLTLAKLYQYTKEGDEFRLYDPDAVPVEGFDVELLSNVECKMEDYSDPFNMKCSVTIPNFNKEDVEEIDNVPTYVKEITDSRKMTATLDFDKALDWCDCYVTMVNPEGELNSATNTETKIEELNKLAERINKALDKNKKIYLGTNANSEYYKIITQYENCINERITEDSLKDIEKYKSGFFTRDKLGRTQITFLIGTSTMSGKMSSLFSSQKMFEERNERTAIICTEEIYKFFDTEKYRIYSFCRNFSELTLDKEIMYLRCLIERIIDDCKPQRIIIASQGTFSYPQVMTNYNYTDVKPHGMLANLLLSCIGCDSVIICSSIKNLNLLKNLISFFEASNIYIEAINISPLHSSISATPQAYNGYLFKMNSVVEDQTILQNIMGFLLEYPYIKVNCNYMDIQEKIDKFLHSDEFFGMYKSLSISKIVNKITMTNKDLYQKMNDIKYLTMIEDGLKEENIDLTDEEKQILQNAKKLIENS